MATNWNVILSNTNNLNDILAILKKVLAALDVKADVTTINEALEQISDLEESVNQIVDDFLKNNSKAYSTLAIAIADIANIPANTLVTITNDSVSENNGWYISDGVTLTKSPYDPLQQSKNYTDDEVAVVKTDLKNYADEQDIIITKPLFEFMQKVFSNINFNVVHDDNGNKFLFSILGKDGKLGFGITSKLKIFLSNHQLLLDRINGFRDASGNYALAIKNNGAVYIPKLKLSAYTISQLDLTNTQKSTKIVYALNPDSNTVYHNAGNGQSLSVGATATPVISTTQPYSNIMFASGVSYSTGNDLYDHSSFAPLIEKYLHEMSLTQEHGETPTSGALNGLSERINEIGLNTGEFIFLGTQSGLGGRTIDYLTETSYNRFEAHINDAKSLCDSLGKTYNVAAIDWIQGEAEISTGTVKCAQYIQKLNYFINKAQATAIKASEQENTPLFFTYQSTSLSTLNRNIMSVAHAQWVVSQRPDVIMASPCYHLEHTTDDVHLTALGSWMLGQYFARAKFYTFILGNKWRPLEPINIDWKNDYIDIKYHVPCKPIQLSTLLVDAVENYGFNIWNPNVLSNRGDDTKVDAISSVEVLSDDTIRISLNSEVTIPTNAVLRYCEAGTGAITGCGNVMDSHGLYDIVTAPDSTEHALYNVGIFFQYDRKYGFTAY